MCLLFAESQHHRWNYSIRPRLQFKSNFQKLFPTFFLNIFHFWLRNFCSSRRECRTFSKKNSSKISDKSKFRISTTATAAAMAATTTSSGPSTTWHRTPSSRSESRSSCPKTFRKSRQSWQPTQPIPSEPASPVRPRPHPFSRPFNSACCTLLIKIDEQNFEKWTRLSLKKN